MSASFRRFSLFPTPVFVFDAPVSPSVREELARRFADESKQVAGIQRSNVGGWHSLEKGSLSEDDVRGTYALWVGPNFKVQASWRVRQ